MQEDSPLKISFFNPDTIKKNSVIVIIGKRRSGKSVLLRDLVYRQKDSFDYIVGMCNTESSREEFEKYIPKANISTVDSERISNLLNEQKVMRDRKTPRRTLLILQDCLGHEKMFYHNVFTKIAYNAHNYDLSLICVLCYCMEMPTHIRSQIDYCFVFQETNRANKKRLFDYFFGVFDRFRTFEKMLDECTIGYKCLVLDSTSNSDNLCDNIFYYEARITDCQQNFMIPSLDRYLEQSLKLLS